MAYAGIRMNPVDCAVYFHMRGNPNMYVIGLTGGIACGKSNAAKVLRELGAEVIDADAISHSFTVPGGAAADAVFARFGTLDRKALGAIVFSDEEERKALNAIVHPLVQKAVDEAVAACRQPLCVVDVPLLYEAGMESIADEVWVVHVPRREQLRRVIKRDTLSTKDALRRIQSQMPTEEKLRRGDAAIDTSGSREETRRQIEVLWQGALRRAEAQP